jgi:DNA-binding XRE family transcriptional regulator
MTTDWELAMDNIDRQIEQIKARLVMARKNAGLTQTQAAKLVGLGRASSLAQHEGSRSIPNLRLFLRLCEVYMVSPIWALTGANPDFDPQPIMDALHEVKVSSQDALNLLRKETRWNLEKNCKN